LFLNACITPLKSYLKLFSPFCNLIQSSKIMTSAQHQFIEHSLLLTAVVYSVSSVDMCLRHLNFNTWLPLSVRRVSARRVPYWRSCSVYCLCKYVDCDKLLVFCSLCYKLARVYVPNWLVNWTS
jgi:hypothetical protein